MWLSDVGIAAVLAGLALWVAAAGSAWPMLRLYAGPYVVCNGWLVLYTLLQHTDVDVPHLGERTKVEWSWQRGAFLTVDRPYGIVLDFLHHEIGSTHVVHHLNHQVYTRSYLL